MHNDLVGAISMNGRVEEFLISRARKIGTAEGLARSRRSNWKQCAMSLPGARRAEHRPAYEFIKRESSHAVEWLFLEREATIAMVAMSQ